MALSYISPDNKALHSLQVDKGILHTRFLPLPRKQEDEEGDEGPFYRYQDEEEKESALVVRHESEPIRNAEIQTTLPSYLTQSFLHDPPLELLCVDNGMPRSSISQRLEHKASLPLLLLYTSKAVYQLSISYTTNTKNPTVAGILTQIVEPFESYLLQHPSECIRWIRAAPNGWHRGGNDALYHVLSPRRGACVLLTNVQLVVFPGMSDEGVLEEEENWEIVSRRDASSGMEWSTPLGNHSSGLEFCRWVFCLQ